MMALDDQDRYVAFCDILGFSSLVRANQHLKLVRIYQRAFTQSAELSLSFGATRQVVDQNDQGVAVADFNQARVHSLLVSDTVLLWTDNDSMKSFVDLVATTRNLLVSCLFAGLPLRGAIAHGPFSSFQSALGGVQSNGMLTFLGRGLVDAHALEKQQAWSGAVVAKECVGHYQALTQSYAGQIPDLADIEYLVAQRLLAEYPVPMKAGSSCAHLALNWPYANRWRPTAELVRNAFAQHGKAVGAPAVQCKIEQTIKFLQAVCPSSR
ncbi:MAG: hypothetical protein VBE63_00005 [Lamprobacter sp.]|uniref:hypothetical protein n=1 Tax=Lamprobacter sp. TaxID=3100796 RepID=UPI002B259BA8|nr:hypothetical protein [Lamprobacter sp.]MEA3638308.1 hypothetical protein [Lamprobacter sp.]